MGSESKDATVARSGAKRCVDEAQLEKENVNALQSQKDESSRFIIYYCIIIIGVMFCLQQRLL